MRPPIRRLAAILALAAALLGPRRAEGAACCGSGHGVGPLLTDAERAALSLGAGLSLEIGAWSERGAFHPLGDGNYRRQLRVEAGWIVRVAGDGQIGVTVPLVYAFERLGGERSSGGGAGDVTAFGRYYVVRSRPSRWYPGVAVTFSALLPTGRPVQGAVASFGADATGLGAAELRPGLAIEKRWLQGFYAMAAGSVGFRTHYHLADGALVALAPRFQIVAAAGPFWDFGLSASLGALVEREAGPSIGGRVGPASARGRTAAIAFVAYDVTRRWTVIASTQIDLPIKGFGENEPLSVAPIVGARYVWALLGRD